MTGHAETSRRGFILVMTLMLIAIAAVALVSVGRSSMGLAVDAVQARQDLQRRWGSISCRHTTLALAPIILDRAGADPDPSPGSIHTQVQLNGWHYSLTLSDEQAKVNINTMLHDHGREVTRTFIRRQCGGQPWSDEITLPTTHRPAPTRDIHQEEGSHRDIISVNHFLPAYDPGGIDQTDSYPLDTLTCWGDGRINLTRAPDDLVQLVLRPLLSTIEITRLRESLSTSETKSLIDALISTGISEDDIPKVLKRLTLDSSCYSVWVAVDTQKRSWYELAVFEMPPASPAESRTAESQESDEAIDAPDIATLEDAQPADLPPVADEITREESDEAHTDSDNNTGTRPRLYLYQW